MRYSFTFLLFAMATLFPPEIRAAKNHLTVTSSNIRDSIDVANHIISTRRDVDPYTARFYPAKNTWFVFYSSGVHLRVLVRYKGGSHWEFSHSDEGLVWLSRDGGKKELVGAKKEASDLIDSGAVKDCCTLEAYSSEEIKKLREFDFPIAIHRMGTFKESSFDEVGDANIIALKGQFEIGVLETLSSAFELECLSITKLIDLKADQSVEIPPFPMLKFFSTNHGETQLRWDASLANMPSLEVLSIVPPRMSEQKCDEPISTFKNNKNLTAFICNGVDRWPIVYASAFKDLPNLEFLAITKLVGYKTLADFESFLDMGSLQYLSVRHHAFHQMIFDRWFSSGKLEKLLYFEGRYVPDMATTPILETLHIRNPNTSTSGSVPDFSMTRTAPDSLSSIKLWLAHSDDLKSIQVPDPGKIQEIVSRSGSFTNVEVLNQYKNLKQLRILRHKKEFKSFDLGAFPEMERFVVASIDGLSSLKSIISHPKLKVLSLNDCKDLEDIGASAPNSTLITARFYKCPKLRSLDALNETTALESLEVLRCDLIPDISKIKSGNNLRRIWIKWSDLLEDESNH